MKKPIAKKTIILYILKLLYYGSSWSQPITQTQIVNVLKSMGVDCDRRTVARNIQYLKDFGIPIMRYKGTTGYSYIHEKDNFFTLNQQKEKKDGGAKTVD